MQAVRQVLMGYYRVPDSVDLPLEFVMNPCGAARRAERRVWNAGDRRIKLVRPRGLFIQRMWSCGRLAVVVMSLAAGHYQQYCCSVCHPLWGELPERR